MPEGRRKRVFVKQGTSDYVLLGDESDVDIYSAYFSSENATMTVLEYLDGFFSCIAEWKLQNLERTVLVDASEVCAWAGVERLVVASILGRSSDSVYCAAGWPVGTDRVTAVHYSLTEIIPKEQLVSRGRYLSGGGY